jgi:Methyltransferase FkbM domain
LIDEAGLDAIDFLKIDVEGAEADVLGGLDLTRHRPRVVLVEAVNPHVKEGDWARWEPLLTSANYSFVFFDNLNRFYLARECEELAGKFPKQPMPWHEVAHLWDAGRVLETAAHPDRALADTLAKGLIALLPTLPDVMISRLIEAGLKADKSTLTPEVARALIGTAEWPGNDVAAPQQVADLVASDRLKAALGRMACMYDGGHLLE